MDYNQMLQIIIDFIKYYFLEYFTTDGQKGDRSVVIS